MSSSDDEIVGEAIYDDNYIREKKRRKKVVSDSEGDDEDYRGDEEELASIDDDDIADSDDYDEDGHYRRGRSGQERHTGEWRRNDNKLKSVDEGEGGLSWGLRRSKRATKSEIDYSKFGDSDFEDEENDGFRDEREWIRATISPHAESDASFGPSDDSQGERESDADTGGFPEGKKSRLKLRNLHDRLDVTASHTQGVDEKLAMRSSATGSGQLQHGPSFSRSDHDNGGIQFSRFGSPGDVKPRRFLDLNVAAPPSAGFEEATGSHARADVHADDDRTLQAPSDEDDDYFRDGGRVDVSSNYNNNGYAPSSSFGPKNE